uniref:Ubiquitin-like domain-containing protein n=1 Tax=Alexandrium catenella TaxID=2925 RepID=A0A7S1S7E3_ALECA|mmetsp:Transcript_89173/g.236998  ORF Transcript_89173/g.236998 Transcript_89173/m.236998 type:complete len:199 (+) Transcript_89173:35-631(+)
MATGRLRRRGHAGLATLAALWLVFQMLGHSELGWLGGTARFSGAAQPASIAARPASLSGKTRDAEGGGTVLVKHPGANPFELAWSPGETVGDLKAAILGKTGIPALKQELRSGGSGLGEDERPLADAAAAAPAGLLEVWLFDERTQEEKKDAPTVAGRQYEEPDTDSIDGIKFLVYLMALGGIGALVVSNSAQIPFLN